LPLRREQGDIKDEQNIKGEVKKQVSAENAER